VQGFDPPQLHFLIRHDIMKSYRTILIIGIIEILIGSVTLFSNFFLILFNMNNKSPNILLFVVVAACVSTLLGIGMLKFNKAAYELLLYFSSVIILSKALIFLGIFHLNGELEVSIHQIAKIPVSETWRQSMNLLKSLISLSYHGFVIYFLRKPDIKALFHI